MQPLDGVARPREVATMFARIAPRYDLMNRLMTLGRDLAWRKDAVELVAFPAAQRVLDIGTGTGDLAIDLSARVPRVLGVDFCEPMLDAGREKARRLGHRRAIDLLPADALRLPFVDASFDGITTAFTVRNVPDLPSVFGEMARVLRPGGRLACLELSPVRAGWLAALFRPYFHRVVPVLGTIVTGDADAYRYLPASVDRFPSADALAGIMEDAGLREVGYRMLNLGTVALHYATR